MNTGEIFLSPMNEEDLEFVNSTRNFKSTRKWLENNELISLEATKCWYENNKPKWLIISFNSKKVGYIRTSDDTKKSLCIGCDINPNYRRQGYAKQTYEILLKSLYAKGYVNIWLDVFEKNIPAISLYRKLGFKPINSRIVRGEKYITMVHENYNEEI